MLTFPHIFLFSFSSSSFHTHAKTDSEDTYDSTTTQNTFGNTELVMSVVYFSLESVFGVMDWRPRMIGVGELGSIPITVATVSPSVFSMARVEGRTESRLPPLAKLLSYESLSLSLRNLDDTIKKYVPPNDTAKEWREIFEQFCEIHPGAREVQWRNFVALLYGRTKLTPKTPGFLLVSSVHTYLKYIAVGDNFLLRFTDCFKAIETQAGSIGTTRVAARICATEIDRILLVISDTERPMELRMGFWLQCYGGCRPIDAARIRENGIDWSDEANPSLNECDDVQALIWRWAKNIRRGSHTQYCPSVKEVFGDPPASQKEWRDMCRQKEYPLEAYSSKAVNDILKELFDDAEVKPTSTSLRDLCHQILKKKFAGVAEQMMVHTVHRSSKSLQAAYLANRPKVVCSKARKKEIKKKKQCSRKIKPKRRNVKRR